MVSIFVFNFHRFFILLFLQKFLVLQTLLTHISVYFIHCTLYWYGIYATSDYFKICWTLIRLSCIHQPFTQSPLTKYGVLVLGISCNQVLLTMTHGHTLTKATVFSSFSTDSILWNCSCGSAMGWQKHPVSVRLVLNLVINYMYVITSVIDSVLTKVNSITWINYWANVRYRTVECFYYYY